jgi:riboflavin kinase/FMN adenylyltransferase
MKVIEWEELLSGSAQRARVSLTIGVFDSLHIGHQRLIRSVVQRRRGVVPTVCTFSKNPAETLGKRLLAGSVLSQKQKTAKLEALGVALVVLIDFSAEISKLTGKKFLELLASHLDIEKLVVGYNFHMGRGRDTGVQELKQVLAGSTTELEIIPATLYRQEVVSSSRIREAILQGRFDEVRDMLKDDYRLDLHPTAVRSKGGRSYVQRLEIEQMLPNNGDYEVLFCTEKEMIPGVVEISDHELQWQDYVAEGEFEIRFRNRQRAG